MALLRVIVHELLYITRMQLWRKLLWLKVNNDGQPFLGGIARPPICWDRLVDNAAEQKIGWLFVDDSRNQMAFYGVNGAQWLRRRVAQERRPRWRFYTLYFEPGAAGMWHMGRVREYNETLKTFYSRLLVLIHISGGQSARETELIIVQYKNEPYNDIRGLFINNNIIIFIIMYNKIMNITA
jgi:hypothetical protein